MMRGWEFNQPVPERGYCWWYVDALSDDGKHGNVDLLLVQHEAASCRTNNRKDKKENYTQTPHTQVPMPWP